MISEQKKRQLLHHTLEPGNDQAVYVGMSGPIRKSHTVLMDDHTMAAEIDRVIEETVRTRLPGFIYIPTDVVTVPVAASRLDKPLNTAVVNKDERVESSIVDKILDAIKSTNQQSILVDTVAGRHGAQSLVRELVELTRFPNYSTHLSRGVLDESGPYFNGVYNGEGMSMIADMYNS